MLVRLVTDEDDGEGYESRPDWAKAVSKRAADHTNAEPDTLTDLQEDALYISRSRLSGFTEIGEGMYVQWQCHSQDMRGELHTHVLGGCNQYKCNHQL